MVRILLVEDDETLLDLISEYLGENGYDVTTTNNAKDALDLAYERNFDLLILDVKLPQGDGFSLLSSLRELGVTTPSIFTTSLNTIDDLEKGYKSGCDDYLKKPFELKELLIRMQALIKRNFSHQNGEDIKILDDLCFHPQSKTLSKNGENVNISSKASVETATSMSEKTQILFKILSLYLVSSVLFLSYFFIHDYQNKKEALILNEVKSLKEIKMGIYMKARMNGLDSVSSLTNEKGVHACIVLENGEKIYKDFECKNINKGKNVNLIDGKVAIFEKIQYMEDNATDELARADIFLVGKNINGEILSLQISTTLKALFFLFALLFIAFYLAKLSLRPLYEKIDTLNHFIKDSTHEINTPLSVISMSIETADLENLNERNLKRFNNISLAAKSLGSIYDALVHLSFNLDKPSKKELIDLNLLTTQRLSYFSPFFAKRGLKIEASLKPSFINADLEDVSKILDNLLSNASKYAAPNSKVSIVLEPNFFSISNTGRGISKEDQMKIFDRYTRFNDDQGGFGIGLNLVKECCKKNNITVKCQSELDGETTFSLSWQS